MSNNLAHITRLTQWLEEYSESIINTARAFAEPAEQEDLIRRILIALLYAMPQWQEDQNIRVFIYRVALATAMDFKFKMRRQQHIEPSDSETFTAEDDTVKNNQLFKSLRKLNPLQRSIGLMSIDNLSVEDMANVIGTDVGTIKLQIGVVEKIIYINSTISSPTRNAHLANIRSSLHQALALPSRQAHVRNILVLICLIGIAMVVGLIISMLFAAGRWGLSPAWPATITLIVGCYLLAGSIMSTDRWRSLDQMLTQALIPGWEAQLERVQTLLRQPHTRIGLFGTSLMYSIGFAVYGTSQRHEAPIDLIYPLIAAVMIVTAIWRAYIRRSLGKRRKAALQCCLNEFKRVKPMQKAI